MKSRSLNNIGYILKVCNESIVGENLLSQEEPVPWRVAYQYSTDALEHMPVLKLRRV